MLNNIRTRLGTTPLTTRAKKLAVQSNDSIFTESTPDEYETGLM